MSDPQGRNATESAAATKRERKIVNLDELIPDIQYIILDGQEHPVNPPSVDTYLIVMRKRRKMKEEDDELAQTEQAIDLITMSCPGVSRERLGQLPLRALTALVDMIQEMMSTEVEGENAPEPEADTGE